jgi:hypothetical protein
MAGRARPGPERHGTLPRPSLCPTMLEQFRRQHHRTAEEITRLQRSQEVLVSLMGPESKSR